MKKRDSLRSCRQVCPDLDAPTGKNLATRRVQLLARKDYLIRLAVLQNL